MMGVLGQIVHSMEVSRLQKESATDGTKKDLNIGDSPGFGGLNQGQIYNPGSKLSGFFRMLRIDSSTL